MFLIFIKFITRIIQLVLDIRVMHHVKSTNAGMKYQTYYGINVIDNVYIS